MVAWVEPRTWVSGETVTYAALNTLGDQLEYLKMRDRVHAYRVDEQELGNDRWERLNWSDDKYDNNDLHFNRRRPHQITIRRDGIYLVICKVNFAYVAGGFRKVMIRRNSAGNSTGGQALGTWIVPICTSNATTVHAQRLARLDKGDDIVAYARQSSGSKMDVNGGTGGEVSFLQLLQVASIP
jgi:hypothetical protein